MENVVEVSIIMGISKRKKYQGRVGGRVGVTYSATRAPFLVTVLASTTNTTAFADCKCSLNVSRIRGCPGISTIFNCRFDSDVTSTDICVQGYQVHATIFHTLIGIFKSMHDYL